MKRLVYFAALLIAVAVVTVSCSGGKPQKTIDNLKAAITGESNASGTYLAFSAKAAQEGFVNIANMFAAASAAETIHVKNHNAVLVKLGEEAYAPSVGTPKVSDTAANLQAAIEGETYEYTEMYPGFLASAEEEKCDEAITSFTWANDAEAVHANLYTQALNILKSTGSDETVAQEWYTCPKCGNLFNTIEGLTGCPLCGVRAASFLKF